MIHLCLQMAAFRLGCRSQAPFVLSQPLGEFGPFDVQKSMSWLNEDFQGYRQHVRGVSDSLFLCNCRNVDRVRYLMDRIDSSISALFHRHAYGANL